jgi:methyl-accepting chemotaxis protein
MEMRFSLSRKISGLIVLTVILVGGTIFWTSYIVSSHGMDEQGKVGIAELSNILDNYVEDMSSRAVGAAAFMAARPDLVAAVEKKDKAAVQSLGKEAMQALRIAFVTIADKDGNVVGRGHSDKAGDSVLGQMNVKRALSDRATAGVEEGTIIKFSMRAGHPIRSGTTVVGSVTTGFDLSTDLFVDEIKKRYGVECTVFQGDTRVSTTIIRDGKRAVGTKMDNPRVIETVLQKSERFVNKNKIMGKNYDTAYSPIKDVDGKTVGMLFIGKDLDVMSRQMSKLILFNLLSAAAVGGFILVLAFFVIRSINGQLNRSIVGLSDSAEQVEGASAEVASASQQLAEGASEQASSLEETSASIEQMSTMTRQNAENANQANILMAETKQVVDYANGSMKELTESMQVITASSEDTAKIIKTIDEIAFQTNLLALNAAVEAARAGEAGAGFAVVADEVRNLAIRASEAAKNTDNLIAESIKRIQNGSEIVTRTNEAFGKVIAGSKKAGDLVGHIASASNEQAVGIEQINKAVSEMDKVVQQNASNAEESAAASEEMNAQALQMKQFIGDLAAVIRGGNA